MKKSDNNPKDKIGKSKIGIHFTPSTGLIELARVMEWGATKAGTKGTGYGLYNWRNAKVSMNVYIDAIFRHLLDIMDGEDIAEDSKLQHMAHIMANASIILDAKELGTLVDDRGTSGKASKILQRYIHG